MSSSKRLLRRLGLPLAACALAALHASASLEASLTRSSVGSARGAADEVVLLSSVVVTRGEYGRSIPRWLPTTMPC